MLDWIAGGKPDHPLADPKRARQLMAGLPAFDPARALDELRGWVDSIMHTAGFRLDERLVLLKQLDEAGQSFQRKLLRDYLGAQRLQKLQDALSPTLLDELTGAGALDFQGIESWLIEDISAGGFGALVPEAKPEWIRVGALVGTRPEGVARWGLGVVRRLRRDAWNQGYIGVETLAREVTAVRLKPVDHGWNVGVAADADGCLPALRPQDGEAPMGQATVALRAGVFSPGESLHMQRQGRTYLLIPAGLREGGQDHDIVSYREMLRDDGDNHE